MKPVQDQHNKSYVATVESLPSLAHVVIDTKRKKIYTQNLVPRQRVYGESLRFFNSKEYREWSPTKSKIAAGLAKGVKGIVIKEGDAVLYLGIASGTTASHISDCVGKSGIIFGIDIAPVGMRQLVFLSHQRHNIVPILTDAGHPEKYFHRICQCDLLIQDLAQKNQVDIFLNNLQFIKPGGIGILSVKSRSVDITKTPRQIYETVLQQLEKHIKIIDWKELDPYEMDHALFVVQK